MILDELTNQLTLSKSDAEIVTRILAEVSEDARKIWLEKIVIKNGKIAGTYYAGISATLSFDNFMALYKALGYEMGKLDLWQDWWCYGAEGCKRQQGYTCNTGTC